MRTFDKYIWKKFAVSFLGSLALLVVVLVAIDVAEKIDDFIDRQVPLEAIMAYYLHFIPFYANLLSPLLVFLSVLFFTAKMAQQTEFVALLASGVSLTRLLRPYLMASFVVFILSLLLHNEITPKNVREIERFEYKYIKRRTYFDQRQVHIKLSREGYFFVRAFDKFDHIGYDGHIERIVNARVVERYKADELIWLDSARAWRLLRVWHIRADGAPRYVEQVDTVLPLAPRDIIRSEFYTRTMGLRELWEEYQRQKYVGGDIAALLEVEMHERTAIPFASIILTVIGFVSAFRKKRGGVALQIGLGLILAFAYVFLLAIAKSAFTGTFSIAWLGVWLPNLTFAILAGLWYWRSPK